MIFSGHTGLSRITEGTTLPRLLARHAAARGGRPAMREKRLGIWRERSWAEALERSRAMAAGLAALGVARGDRVGVIGDNRPELYWAMLAAQMIGAVAVPLFQEANATELGEIIARAGLEIVMAEDQEQVDKFLAIRAEAEQPRHIVFQDGRGLKRAAGDGLISSDEMCRRGATWGGDISAEMARGEGSDLAVILFTSGTAKGVMLSHDNIVATASAAVAFNGLGEADEVLAWLPMAWVGDLVFSLGQSLVAGFCLSCPESGETVLTDMREIGPTYLIAPPRILETLLTSVSTRMASTGGIKRRLFAAALAGDGGGWLHERVICAPLRNALGLGRVRSAYVAGEAVGAEVLRFFRAMGLNLKQLYGLTEASGLVSAQADGKVRPDAVGAPVPGLAVRIGPDGAVEVQGPGVFLGYFGDDAASAEARTADGWLRTGDAGEIGADGQLRVLDRMTDLGRLADGTPFMPKAIENRLKAVPYIREAVALADERDFVACLVELDAGAVGAWVERQGQHVAGLADLVGREDVAALIGGSIREANAELGQLAVRRFAILPRELDAEVGELTRMRKPRRAVILERRAALVAALFTPEPGAGAYEVRP